MTEAEEDDNELRGYCYEEERYYNYEEEVWLTGCALCGDQCWDRYPDRQPTGDEHE